MAIDPTTTTTVKVSELASAGYNTTDLIPHEVAGILKKGNLQDLATFIGGIISTEGAVGFRAVQVNDGETLPATDEQEFILVGPGTYPNVGGGPTITTTEPLNALVSNATYWFIGVEIPITATGVWGTITGVLSDQTDLNDVLDAKADLVDGKVPNSQLPSYVDDVIEVANFASLPATGETGKIYVTIDTGNVYRWSGSAYIRIADEAASWGTITGTLSDQTDLQSALNAKEPTITSGTTSQYYRGDKTFQTLNSSTVGLGNVNNTSDANKPVSTATQTALDLKANLASPTFTGTVGGITKSMVGLGNVDNTTDLNKPISTATQTALDLKQNSLSGNGFVKISGTTISYDNSTYALDSSVVHLTGSEIITGSKQFSASFSTALTIINSNTGFSGQRIQNTSTNSGLLIENNSTGIGLDINSGVSTGKAIRHSSGAFLSYLGDWNATSFIKIGGTSSQFLKADGSVDSTTYQSALTNPITGTGTTNYIPKFTGATSLDDSAIFQSGSNIGIGTTSPLGILHLYTPAATTRMVMDGDTGQSKIITFRTNGLQRFGMYVNNTAESGSNAGSDFQIRAYNDAGTLLSTPIFIKRSSGNVGIGTTSPAEKLHVYGNIYIDGNTKGYTAGLSGYRTYTKAAQFEISSYQSVGGPPYTKTMDIVSNADSEVPSEMRFLTADSVANPTERMRITSGGNVGIGTSSPAAKLSVNGDVFLTSTGRSITFNSDTNLNTQIYEISGSINLYTGGQDRMRITSGGNVGIGTSIPTEKLDISGNLRLSDTAPYLTLKPSGWSGSAYIQAGINLAQSAAGDYFSFQNLAGKGFAFQRGTTTDMLINSSGNVGIGVTPQVWDSAYNVLQVSDASFVGNADELLIGHNLYRIGEDVKYISSSRYGSLYSQNSGAHWFATAPIGTAGADATLTTRMILTNDGKLGIGTTSPSANLEVSSGADTGIKITSSSGAYTGYINIGSAAGGAAVIRSTGLTNPFLFEVAGSERMRITSGGNVGIGTITPSQKLVVDGGTTDAAPIFAKSSLLYSGKYYSGILSGYTTDTNKAVQFGYIYDSTNATNSIAHITAYGTAEGSQFAMRANGNVQIGTTTDAGYKLDVNGTGRFSGLLQVVTSGIGGVGTIGIKGESAHLGLQNAAGNFKGWLGYYNAAVHGSDVDLNIKTGYGGSSNIRFGVTGDSGEAMRITSGGNVLVNTTASVFSTAAQFELLYTGNLVFGMNMKTTFSDGVPINFVNSAGSRVGYIYQTNVATAYITSSDYRLKQDLKPINGLDLVSKIKVYDYEWKSDETRAYGVLAHELQEVIPQAVNGEKDGENMQGVDYSKLVPILVQAIQELKQEIEILKNK